MESASNSMPSSRILFITAMDDARLRLSLSCRSDTTDDVPLYQFSLLTGCNTLHRARILYCALTRFSSADHSNASCQCWNRIQVDCAMMSFSHPMTVFFLHPSMPCSHHGHPSFLHPVHLPPHLIFVICTHSGAPETFRRDSNEPVRRQAWCAHTHMHIHFPVPVTAQ